ncbi:MAG: putative DNA binding domain-containing protein [Candidatus Aminicenantes bacterium]|nr:MAG: putative DNA binding domain-containing protein [Candidatus Aminicenantes bacterium]
MFDLKEELLAKIHLGEDSVLELKSLRFRGSKIVGPIRESLADELAAFANSDDGVLLLGVNDKTREIEGIPLDKLDAAENFVRQICNDSVNPPLSIKIVRLMLPDTSGEEKPVLKIDIPRSLFVHKSPGGYFQRQGSSKRELTPDVLARLFQQRSQARIIRFDEQVVPNTSLADLDENLWCKFIRSDLDDPVTVMRKLRLIALDSDGNEKATVGGLLLCSREPHQWLPGAFIEAVHYRGTKRDSHYQIDARKITGPLDKQIMGAVFFVKKNMRIGAIKRPGRIDIPQFSVRAVFEAVVNAAAHRDYSIHGSKIRLFMFEDRLELYSPGALPNTLTIESLPLRQATRNELVTSLLAKCPLEEERMEFGRQFLMDKRGEGVPIIIAESEKLAGKPPVYKLIDDTELMLTIFSAVIPSLE